MSIENSFMTFHRENPRVYSSLVSLVRRYQVKHGAVRVGIGMFWELLRWDMLMSTDHYEFKLNNNYRSRYARLIMDNEPGLGDCFQVRELRAG